MSDVAGVTALELREAWRAIRDGRFRAPDPELGPASPPAPTRWQPGVGEWVVPVVKAGGGCGSSTLAVAIASAVATGARVVECGSATTAGLAGASTAELGRHPGGWARGLRGQVLLEWAADRSAGIERIPLPPTPDRAVRVTVLDVSFELGQLLASTSWIGHQVATAPAVVVVTVATVPGLRQLEAALGLLAAGNSVAAVVGPSRARWPKPVRHAIGPLGRAVDDAGHLVVVPDDARLRVCGLDSSPLPAGLLEAGRRLLDLTLPTATTGDEQ